MKKWIFIAVILAIVQGCSTLAMNFPPFTFGRADGEYQALAYQKHEPTVNIYSRDWELGQRVRGNEIFDRNWRLEFRIKDNAIYDRGWSLKFRMKR
jgi:hypothetical protein